MPAHKRTHKRASHKTTHHKPAHLVKGSEAAKRHMAKVRAAKRH